jgi:tRNA-modifying protein YgfZ
MNTAQTFLQTIGASEIDGDSLFADEPADLTQLDGNDVLMSLSLYGVLAVAGPDTEKFLQGQLTCDVAATNAALSTPGAFCTPKGRMVCSFQLARPAAERVLLRMRRDLLDVASATLQKYIVFSKAKLERLDDTVVIGLHGPNTAAMVREFLGDAPNQQHATLIHGDCIAVQRDGEGTRFELWAPLAQAQAFWDRYRDRCVIAGSRYWRWLSIRAGEAEVCGSTAEMFIPQMLNYHLNGAVNFKKGCYTGQEIVARAYYRGQVKRHLIRAQLEAPAPVPGTSVEDENQRSIGNVVDSVQIDSRRTELLGVSGADENADKTLSISGTVLQPLALPYAIP